ncbi:MAG: response regulator transcription factor [Candidatus Nanopelagicales bacterium]
MTTTVLVIEDDPTLARALLINLRARGFDPHTARTGTEGIAVLERLGPDVVILDLGLPDMDGAEVIEALRRWSTVPVIVLSARAEGSEKVRLLGLGADDYVTKPFQVEELIARIRAAVRRGSLARSPVEAAVFSTPHFTIDLARATVTKAGELIRLTPTEWRVLEVLARHPESLVSRPQLLETVWGEGYERENHYLRLYMSQLRHKLEPDPAHPRYLITEPGRGYRLRLDPGATAGP